MLLSEAALELKSMNEGRENSASVMAAEEKAKKTAGGVFLTLLKKRVSPELRKKVFKAEHEQKRQKRFAAALLTNLTIETSVGSYTAATEGQTMEPSEW